MSHLPPRILHWDLQVHILVLVYNLKLSQHLQFSGQRVTCYPAVPFFITDEKDLATCVTGLYASGRAHRPCNLCDLDFGNNADITQKGPQRQITQLKQVFSLQLTFINNYVLFFVVTAACSVLGPWQKNAQVNFKTVLPSPRTKSNFRPPWLQCVQKSELQDARLRPWCLQTLA